MVNKFFLLEGRVLIYYRIDSK